MNDLSPPHGSRNPFGQVSMQEQIDRLRANRQKWMSAGTVLKHGIFVSATRFTKHKLHMEYLNKKFFPQVEKQNGHTMLYHLKYERSYTTNNKTVYNPRGGLVCASRQVLCDYIGRCVDDDDDTKAPFDIDHCGLYWECYSPEGVVAIHPYFDIDIKLPDRVLFSTVYQYVKSINEQMHHVIDTYITNDTQNAAAKEHTTFYNTRSQDNNIKHSFHIHYYNLYVNNMQHMSQLVQHLNKTVRKKPIYDYSTNTVIESNDSLLDLKTYNTNQQLFRLPYCGKFGNDEAALRPITIEQKEDDYSYSIADGRHSIFLQHSCTWTLHTDEFIQLSLSSNDYDSDDNERHSRYSSSSDSAPSNNDEWTTFWHPLVLRILLPQWNSVRRAQMMQLQTTGTLPCNDATPERLTRLPGFEAAWSITVPGDTFCVYDTGHTPYSHSANSNCVTYIIDFNKLRLAQQCFKCRPTHLQWHPFLSSARTLAVQRTHSNIDQSAIVYDIDCKNGYKQQCNVLLHYFHDYLCYHTELKRVYVYDKLRGIWLSGSDGNRLALTFVDELNSAYTNYRVAVNRSVYNKLVHQWQMHNPGASTEESEKQKHKFRTQMQKNNGKIREYLHIPFASRKQFIANLATMTFPHQVQRMEIDTHMIPLLDNTCLNIFTWETTEIQPFQYFTSRLDAKIIDIQDERVREFESWQNNVCCGDKEYVLYKRRITGLSLTMMNFDRAVYVALGPVGRNGKSSEATLLDLVCMTQSPNRGYTLSREYLTKQAQNGKSANAADTVLMDTVDKCIVIADECRDVPLDNALIKSFVSGDRANARNLYETERATFLCHFTMWIIANKTLKIDYTDKALMDRLRLMPYNAQWVTNPAQSKQKTKMPYANFVFKENPYFKSNTLPTWKNAMVTSCLRALHEYFQSLPKDPNNRQRPAKLSSFPVPAAVTQFTRDVVNKEHILLGFLARHLKQTTNESEFIDIDQAFSQFRAFGRNENTAKSKFMNVNQFIDGLEAENFNIDLSKRVIKNYTLKTPVVSFDTPIADGDAYYPGPAMKRARYD